ncbi:MAG: tetratricopeptide repeat protein [Planctomycetes bacterium]|nr:tetratricopeptide repeat protein [Planctomycetota bacterium]
MSAAAVPLMFCLLTGCASTGGGFTPPWKKSAAKVEPPKDSIVLTGRTYEMEPVDPKLRAELDAAQRLMHEKKYGEAERIYHMLAIPGHEASWWSSLNIFDSGEDSIAKKRSKYPRSVYEEALFGEAESQRMQKNYRDAVNTYSKLLNECIRTKYTNRACQGLFEIADYWLEPTRKQMDEYQEQLKGKRWFVTPAAYIHFGKDMPTMDAQGNALLILNTIWQQNVKGEMAKRALMYLGTIHFYNKSYQEADFYFTKLKNDYEFTPEAAKAIKQSIICKQLMTGGSAYDLRGVEESKKLLMQAQGAYPEFGKDTEWVKKQLVSINIQQADRDFKIAEFYQRTGHPGSAYFYFELVCRRYPGTRFAEDAAKRKDQLRARAEREHREVGGPAPLQDATTAPTPGLQSPRLLPRLLAPPAKN